MTRKTTNLSIQRETVGPQWDGNTKLGNWDANRVNIDRIVIHTMVGTVVGANARFNDPHSNVSAHYGVGYDGQLHQWLDEDLVAYHAGDYPFNQRSIGIEHEDMGNYNDPRPDILYNSSAALVADICKFYDIPCNSSYIVPHHSVVNTACPDSLDINRIINQASVLLTTPQVDPNKVKVDLGQPWGIMEVQAIRSSLNDLKMNSDGWMQKYQECINSQPDPNQPPTDPIPPQTPPSSNWLARFIIWLLSHWK